MTKEQLKQLDITTYHRDCLTVLKEIQRLLDTPIDENHPEYMTDGEIVDEITDMLSRIHIKECA